MIGWWRRRWFSVLAVVVLLALAIGVSLLIDGPKYLASHVTQPQDVPAGVTAQYAGLGIRLVGRQDIPADSAKGRELEVPSGTELVIVTLHLDPSAAPKDRAICTVALVQSTSAGDRVWTVGYAGVSGYRTPHGDTVDCTSNRGKPYTMQGAALVPAGAAKHSVVRVSVSRALPSALVLH